jgi:hypothetical protein
MGVHVRLDLLLQIGLMIPPAPSTDIDNDDARLGAGPSAAAGTSQDPALAA